MTDILMVGLLVALLVFCALLNSLLMSLGRTTSKLETFNEAIRNLEEINTKFTDYSQRVERYQDTLADIHLALNDIRFELDSIAIRERKSSDD